MNDVGKKHRVIGIRHALKTLKEAGLVEADAMFPSEAVDDVNTQILLTAKKWYQIGARRGAIEAIDAFLDGDFTIRTKNGEKQVVAHSDGLEWSRRLHVTIGNTKTDVPKTHHKLDLQDLEFEV